MSLTRRDIAETSIRTIAAFLTSVAIVAGGIAFFFSLAQELRAQQEKVLTVQEAITALAKKQDDVATKEDLKKFATKADIKEILAWVRDRRKEEEAQKRAEKKEDSSFNSLNRRRLISPLDNLNQGHHMLSPNKNGGLL